MRPLISTVLTGLLVASAPTAASFAQDADDASSEDWNEEQLFYSINFPGGTMAEYTDLLLEVFPNASIVLMPGTEGFKLPAIQARIPEFDEGRMAVSTALDLVCDIPGVLIFPRTEYAEARAVEGTLFASSFGFDKTIFRIEGVPTPRTRGRTSVPDSDTGFGSAKMAVAVHPLVEITEKSITMEEILGTLKVAFDLEGDAPLPVMRYHEPTSILFVRGTHTQLETVETTLKALLFIAGARVSDFQTMDIMQEKDQKIAKLEDTVRDLSLHRQQVTIEKNEEIQTLNGEIAALRIQLEVLRNQLGLSGEKE